MQSSMDSDQPETKTMKKLKQVYNDKYVQSTMKIANAAVEKAYGDLKDKMDAKSLNILITAIKEKIESLQSYAKEEFVNICTEYDLNAKFAKVEQALSSTASTSSTSSSTQQASSSSAKGEGEERPVGGGGGGIEPSPYDEQRYWEAGVTPEVLARHRRMMIKRKEMEELKEILEQEVERFGKAEADLKVTKDKLANAYNDLSSITPEAEKLIQRCAEN